MILREQNKEVGNLFSPHAITDGLDAALALVDAVRGCVTGRSLSPEEGDPAPQVEQAGKGGGYIGECGGGEDAASPVFVFR